MTAGVRRCFVESAHSTFSRANITHRKKKKIKKAGSGAVQSRVRPETAAPDYALRPRRRRSRAKGTIGARSRGFTPRRRAHTKSSPLRDEKCRQRLGSARRAGARLRGLLEEPPAASAELVAKSESDTVLREYVLYWTAQANRLGATAEALADLQTFQQEYPNTAMREQLLEASCATATETGHAQEAIEALNAYAPTNTRPTLLLERAQAYKAAASTPTRGQGLSNALLQISSVRRGKSRRHRFAEVAHELGREYPYPRVEMQEQRAQTFSDAHKWKEARVEFEKLLAMVHDPANPQRAARATAHRAGEIAAQGLATTSCLR